MEIMGCRTVEELAALWHTYTTEDFVQNYRDKREFMHNLTEFFFRCDNPNTNNDRFENINDTLNGEFVKTADDVYKHIREHLKFDGDDNVKVKTLIRNYLVKNITVSELNANVIRVRDTYVDKTWLMSKSEYRLLSLLS